MTSIQLSDRLFNQSSLQPAKKFNENARNPTTSLDFDSTGQYCVVAAPGDDSILVYDCFEGVHKRTVYSSKYGVDLVKFAHRSNNVIYASTKGEDDAIRYLSLHDNAYLRYFRGHKRRVTQIELSPLNDTFISLAPQDSLCLWDLRSPNVQGLMTMQGSGSGGVLAFDPQGYVFAVGTSDRYIRLYDAKKWSAGPFAAFELVSTDASISIGNWTGLQFSPDGKDLLLTAAGSQQSSPGFLIDSFDGTVKQIFITDKSTINTAQLTFTPDSQYILGGSNDGGVAVWKRSNNDQQVKRPLEEDLAGPSNDPINSVKWNPKAAMMVTTGAETTFWLPDL